MAECIVRLEKIACPELVEAASQTLKVQITATGPYRYRLEGIVRALLHIIQPNFPSRILKMNLRNDATGHWDLILHKNKIF